MGPTGQVKKEIEDGNSVRISVEPRRGASKRAVRVSGQAKCVENIKHQFFSPCHALPSLALPCLALARFALPCLVLPCLALPSLALKEYMTHKLCATKKEKSNNA